MATPTLLRRCAGAVGLALPVALALALPVRSTLLPAAQSPEQATVRAEDGTLMVGLLWGKGRSWSRVASGWTVVWQPAHGAWLVRAWVPDDGSEVLWRLEAAPWLPGARLNAETAAVLTSAESAAVARDRVGRRDWIVGSRRLLGALPAGGDLPQPAVTLQPVVEGLLAGLLLAGAATRRLVPAVPARGWRHAVLAAGLTLLVALLELTALAGGWLQPGVRPWVAQLAFVSGAVLLLAVLAFAATRFPVSAGPAPTALLPLALAVGILAGRASPLAWLAGTAGLNLRLLVWAACAVLAGWLAGLAGDGLRELLRFVPMLRRFVVVALAVAAVARGGPWLGVALAVLAAAAVGGGGGAWLAASVIWGWQFGCVWASCAWPEALWSAMAFLMLGAAVAVAVVVRSSRPGTRADAVVSA
jgi:hypothetical protein